MVTYTLTEDQVKSALNKAKQISALLGGKVSKKCLDMGWSSTRHRMSTERRIRCIDNFEYRVVSYENEDNADWGLRLSSKRVVNSCGGFSKMCTVSCEIPIIDLHLYYVRDAATEIENDLRNYVCGGISVDDNFKRNVKRVTDFNASAVDTDDLVDESVLFEMAEVKKKELDALCDKMKGEYFLLDYRKNNDTSKAPLHKTNEPIAFTTPPPSIVPANDHGLCFLAAFVVLVIFMFILN